MSTGVDISKEKQKVVGKLAALDETLLGIGNRFVLDFGELREKIKKALENVENDTFSIAFFGAFSDGKSTILSALIDSLDIEISPAPKTDQVKEYQYQDYRIIDTPGLFSDNQLHDERTRKYISEANVVIYTLDPVNPLKEAHIPTIKWILSDLKKYDSTIFVLNRMDAVADLEDNADFELNAAIKKKVVADELQKVIGVGSVDMITCVAADPFEQGLAFWRKQPEDYQRLSRIGNLELLIQDFGERYRNELVLKAGMSVIRDASALATAELGLIKDGLKQQVSLTGNQLEELEARLSTFEKDVNRSYILIKEDFIALREDLLIEIDAVSSRQELAEYLERRLGEDGYILQEQIDLMLRKHTGSLLEGGEKMLRDVEDSLAFHSKIQAELAGKLSKGGKQALKALTAAPTRKVADAVLKLRDMLKIPFKFKPWGAMKLAKGFQAGIPIIAEVLDFGFKFISSVKMEKKRNELKKQLKDGFKEMIQGISQETYISTYFPYLSDLRGVVTEVADCRTEMIEKIADVEEITRQIEDVELF